MIADVIDAHRLLVLRALDQHGSLSAAARELGFTQPALSHHVRALEREVRTAVVQRHGRGLRLTEAGRILVARAENLARELRAAEDEVRSLVAGLTGRVRIACFPSFTAAVLPPVLRGLRDRHPGFELQLVEAEPPDALRMLANDDVDLAIAFDYPNVAGRPNDPPHVVEVDLGTDRLLAVLPAGHSLANARAVRFRQLAGEQWIAGCVRCREHLEAVAALDGVRPTITFATDDYMAVQSLVRAGMGVSTLPALVLDHYRIPGVAVVAITPIPRRRLFAATLPGVPTPALQATLDALQAAGRPGHNPKKDWYQI